VAGVWVEGTGCVYILLNHALGKLLYDTHTPFTEDDIMGKRMYDYHINVEYMYMLFPNDNNSGSILFSAKNENIDNLYFKMTQFPIRLRRNGWKQKKSSSSLLILCFCDIRIIFIFILIVVDNICVVRFYITIVH
ncbi:hypothetical protein ACJX0J_037538, partial [Zea mays]